MLSDKAIEKAWFDFSDELIITSYKLFAAVNKKNITSATGAANKDILALALLARQIRHHKSTVILLRSEMIVEARSIVRQSWENLFTLAAIAAVGDAFLDEMRKTELAAKQARGQFLLKVTKGGNDAVWAQNLRSFLLENKDAGGSQSLAAKTVAAKGSIENGYIIYGQLSADASHPTTDALVRHIIKFDENNTQGIEIVVDPPASQEELMETLEFSLSTLIGACVACNQILGGTEADSDIAEIADKYASLTKK